MLVSILEGRITSEKWDIFEQAYRNGIKKIPTELIHNIVIQDVNDPLLWRIISLWRSPEDFERLKDNTVLPSCRKMFRKVGVEPTVRVFKVRAQHQHV